jgi:hypothetical protein
MSICIGLGKNAVVNLNSFSLNNGFLKLFKLNENGVCRITIILCNIPFVKFSHSDAALAVKWHLHQNTDSDDSHQRA